MDKATWPRSHVQRGIKYLKKARRLKNIDVNAIAFTQSKHPLCQAIKVRNFTFAVAWLASKGRMPTHLGFTVPQYMDGDQKDLRKTLMAEWRSQLENM